MDEFIHSAGAATAGAATAAGAAAATAGAAAAAANAAGLSADYFADVEDLSDAHCDKDDGLKDGPPVDAFKEVFSKVSLDLLSVAEVALLLPDGVERGGQVENRVLQRRQVLQLGHLGRVGRSSRNKGKRHRLGSDGRHPVGKAHRVRPSPCCTERIRPLILLLLVHNRNPVHVFHGKVDVKGSSMGDLKVDGNVGSRVHVLVKPSSAWGSTR